MMAGGTTRSLKPRLSAVRVSGNFGGIRVAWNDNLSANSAAYAIAASENPRVRVVAGPGTGKSFAMKRRVARLLEQGTAAAEILPVTFTRVAAEDLHRELVGMGVPGCENLHGTTLHALSMRILMRNHVLQATGRVARPLNDFEIAPFLSDLKAQHGGKKATQKLKQAYEAAWARLQHELPGYTPSAADAAFVADLLSWMNFHRAMLIGEVIPQVHSYLRHNPAAPERTEFSKILVDEYQDLNRAEQSVIELLSDDAEVCIVGDDDQSIYSFKHAHPSGIIDWVENNVDADDLALIECRRCPTTVVAMANSLITHNQQRPSPRQLTAYEPNGPGLVSIVQYNNLANEVSGVTNLVLDLIAGGIPPGDILILAQRDVIGSPIFKELGDSFVPVRSYYAESELENIEAQRKFSILKLLADQDDRVALRWLVGVDGNDWNVAGYRRVRAYCEQNNLSPWQVLDGLANGDIHLPHTGPIVLSFIEVRDELAALQAHQDIQTVVDQLFAEDDPTVSQIRSLSLSVIEGMDGELDFGRFVQELIGLIAQPEIPEQVTEVRIMSLHKSKGLSAPVTIIAGCVQGLLPKLADLGTPADDAAAMLEEQRRLFFVGLTRVKADPTHGKPGRLVLTYSMRMSLADAMGSGITPAAVNYGVASLHASQFLAELGPAAPAPVAG